MNWDLIVASSVTLLIFGIVSLGDPEFEVLMKCMRDLLVVHNLLCKTCVYAPCVTIRERATHATLLLVRSLVDVVCLSRRDWVVVSCVALVLILSRSCQLVRYGV